MATIKELNFNPDSFFGLKFPLGYDADNGGFFPRARTLKEQAFSNLKNLILTNKGERVGQPDFGCDISSLLFEQITEETGQQIKSSIQDAVENWLPYITIADVFVTFQDSQPNAIYIAVEFTVDVDDPNAVQTITFTFNTGI